MTLLNDISVILVEDDHTLAEATMQALEIDGAEVSHFDRADNALDAIDRNFGGVVISDIRLPGIDGIAFFERLRAIDETIPVILVSGHGDVDMAVAAMRNGAFDFLTKPFSSERLAASIAQAAANRALVLENRRLRDRLDRSRAIPGDSAASERLRTLVSALAATDVDVAIAGARGTGKTHTASLLHDLGPRRSRPLVTIDAGTALHPDAELLLFGRDPGAGLSHTGLIERARGGTLVLDEIEGVEGALRARLDTLVENRTILPLGAERPRKLDVRIVAVLPEGMVSDSRTLLHRSGPIEITLPSLAERREDIAEFFSRFVARHEREFGTTCEAIDADVLNHIHAHEWSGNLRELDAFAKKLVIGNGASDASAGGERPARGLRDQVAEFEKAVIENALREAKGSVPLVEKALLLPTKTLYDKLSRYGLKAKDFRQGGKPSKNTD